MTTTTTYSGVDPSGRSSSRVLRPPGGASNFSLGFGDQPEQPARKYKMASNIFGPPDDLPAPSNRPGLKDDCVSGDSSVPERRPFAGTEYGGSAEHTGETEEYETMEADDIAPVDSEVSSESATTDSVPEVPVPAPSRRNPPGGRSTLVLG